MVSMEWATTGVGRAGETASQEYRRWEMWGGIRGQKEGTRTMSRRDHATDEHTAERAGAMA